MDMCAVMSESHSFGSHMEGLASSCCLLEPSECSSLAKASLVGARKVAVTYGECTSSAQARKAVSRLPISLSMVFSCRQLC